MCYIHGSVNGFPTFSQESRVSSTVSCARDIHGYYACVYRGEEIVWEKSIAFSGHARELFTLDWELSNAHHGDRFKVIGFVRGDNNDPVIVGSCEGDVSRLWQAGSLVIS